MSRYILEFLKCFPSFLVLLMATMDFPFSFFCAFISVFPSVSINKGINTCIHSISTKKEMNSRTTVSPLLRSALAYHRVTTGSRDVLSVMHPFLHCFSFRRVSLLANENTRGRSLPFMPRPATASHSSLPPLFRGCVTKSFFCTSHSFFFLRSSVIPKASTTSTVGSRPVVNEVQNMCRRPDGEEHLRVLSQLSSLLKKKEMAFSEKVIRFEMAYTRSYRFAESCLWVLWGSFLFILFLLFLGTYRIFSWNVIEPITYLLGYTQILCGLWWYQRHGLEFSCSIFRKSLAESYYQRTFMRHIICTCRSDKGRLFAALFCPTTRICLNCSSSHLSMKGEMEILTKRHREIQLLRSLLQHEKVKMR